MLRREEPALRIKERIVSRFRHGFKAGVAGLVMGLGLSAAVTAQSVESQLPFTPGVAQDAAEEGAQLRNLRLDHPLVQQKYLNDPELLRFLRGTYAEACTRGLMNEATKYMKTNADRQFSPEAVKAAAQVLESNRIWKLTSTEMELFFGSGYVHSAYYCDCMMKELTDVDLVNPVKGLEIVNALPASTQATCEMLAGEKAAAYAKKYPDRSRK